jgi:hypothetical protein
MILFVVLWWHIIIKCNVEFIISKECGVSCHTEKNIYGVEAQSNVWRISTKSSEIWNSILHVILLDFLSTLSFFSIQHYFLVSADAHIDEVYHDFYVQHFEWSRKNNNEMKQNEAKEKVFNLNLFFF